MKTIEHLSIRRFCNILTFTALFSSLTTPVTPFLLHAANAASEKGAPASLRAGDLYGGGKVVYLYKPGEAGYVAGQTHGLVAATSDIGNGMTWANAIKLCKDYRGGGFNNWRLPDKAELDRMFINKLSIGGFREGTTIGVRRKAIKTMPGIRASVPGSAVWGTSLITTMSARFAHSD